MPFPKALTRLNRDFSNKITRPFAAWLPWFAVLHHIGRRSGNSYSTPMMAWRDGQMVTVALFYGSDLDWLKNAQTNESVMSMGGKKHPVGHPRPIPESEGKQRVPRVMRGVISLLDVTEFVEFPIL